MDTPLSLDELNKRLAHYQSDVGQAVGMTERYKYTFRLFGRSLEDVGLERTSAAFTTAVMERSTIWLRDTPVSPQHGKSRRAELGVHGPPSGHAVILQVAAGRGTAGEAGQVPDIEDPQAADSRPE